ncbi:hypothetical protein [Nonomuraea sp. NPDC050310]|uniref:hypothetical protein n=1 Tax=Nonomuraea sp. NPDC050310 TaxID=3154935 RepID=UPI0033EE3659
MAAHDTITPGLTAEELLAELAQPDLADARREQLLEQLTRMHRGLIMEAATATATAVSRSTTSCRRPTSG